jgi:hypothetical protein
VLPLYHRVYRFHIYVYFPLQNSMYQNLNQIFNILNSENLIYSLYVCTSVFLLCQESFHMILDNNLLFYDGGVTTSSVSLTKDKSHKNFLLIHYKNTKRSRCHKLFSSCKPPSSLPPSSLPPTLSPLLLLSHIYPSVKAWQ